MTERKKINLLIREIAPVTANDRTMRENLRRIKSFLDGLTGGTISTPTVVQTITIDPDGAQIALATVYETQLCTVDNQTIFTLSLTPADSSKVEMSVNGVEQRNGSEFTVSGTTVTFYPLVAEYEMELVNEFGYPDQIKFTYIKA